MSALIAAARYLNEWNGDPSVDSGVDRVCSAVRALPPDAVVVSAALLIQAADALDPSCSDMRLLALAARLRDAVTGAQP